MRIATFNIENLDHPVEHRLSVLRPAFERLEADIVCLQEVNSQKIPNTSERHLGALEQLLDGTDYAGFHRAETQSEVHAGAASTHNLVTLSRYPIVENRQIWHHRVPPLSVPLCTTTDTTDVATPVRFDRPFLATEIDVGGTRLHVINVHLRAPLAASIPDQKISTFSWKSVSGWAEGYYLSGLKRTGQALEVRIVVDEIFDADATAHVLVTGDFNAEEHETGPRIVAGAPEDTGNPELAGRSLVLLDRAINSGQRFSVIHYGNRQMLDHMFASHALYGRFRAIAVHNEALGDEVVGYSRDVVAAGSYHAALVATFRSIAR